jgi:hypothetical protein
MKKAALFFCGAFADASGDHLGDDLEVDHAERGYVSAGKLARAMPRL